MTEAKPETAAATATGPPAAASGETAHPRRFGGWLARWGASCTLVVLLAAAIIASVLGGHPDRLPAVALGSPLLLYATKAAAFFLLGLALVVVLARAFQHGDLPIEITKDGLRWEDVRQVKTETDATVTALREAVERLEKLGAAHDARMTVLEEMQDLILEEME